MSNAGDQGSDDRPPRAEDGTESAEWRDLARELREADGEVHDEALDVVRELVRSVRAREAARKHARVALFGPRKVKPTA